MKMIFFEKNADVLQAGHTRWPSQKNWTSKKWLLAISSFFSKTAISVHMFELLCHNLLLVKETRTYLSLSNFNTASVSSSLQSLPLDMPSADDECFDLLKLLLPPCSPEEVLFFKLLLCMWFFRPTELRSQRDCAEALPSNISLTNLACSAARIWRLCATSFLK